MISYSHQAAPWRIARAILFTVLLALLLAGCDSGPKKRLIVEKGMAQEGFARLPGWVNVFFYNLPGDWKGLREVSFHRQRIEWKRLVFGPRVRRAGDFFRGSKDFPKTLSGYLTSQSNVWEISRDKKFMAVAAAPEGSGQPYSSLVIVDIKKRAVAAAIDGGGKWGVASLGWSPDGNYVAFIRYDWRDRNLFAENLQDGYFSAWLVIVDRAGKIVAQTQLTDEHNIHARVVWK